MWLSEENQKDLIITYVKMNKWKYFTTVQASKVIDRCAIATYHLLEDDRRFVFNETVGKWELNESAILDLDKIKSLLK